MTKHPPSLGSIYKTSSGIRFRVHKIAHVEHDAWIEYQNIRTKEHYSCRLAAFLDRFFLEQPRNAWTYLTR